MHSRYQRPAELARHAQRRALNLTQKHGAFPNIEAISSGPVAANQVVTGAIVQYNSGFGTGDNAALGFNGTAITGILTTQPLIQASVTRASGHLIVGYAWPTYDTNRGGVLFRQSSPLAHGPGFLVFVRGGNTFIGSSATVTMRDPLPTDGLTFNATRIPPPAPRPQSYPAPPPPRAIVNRPAPQRAPAGAYAGRIPGRVAHNFYAVGTIFYRS